MSLKDLHLRNAYDSDFDDVLNDFYIPALSNSIKYKRLAGFFTSSSLAVAAKGLSKFIANGGHMKLICGAKLRKADVEAIKEGYEKPARVIEMMMMENLEKLEDEFIQDHVRALGWMVANNKLQIKVAVVVDANGLAMDRENVEKQGIFHQKVGILEDSEGNKMSFSGSDNETASAWQANIEEFKVFRSWKEYEKGYLNADLERFEKFWKGTSKRTRVVNVPIAIKDKLIEMAPDNIEELDLEKWLKRKAKEEKKKIELRGYQKEAVERWLENGKRGVFKMATGTGKTFTALICINSYLEKMKRYGNRILIIVPQKNLAEQWKEDLLDFTSENDFIFTYYSEISSDKKRNARKVWIKDFGDDGQFNIYLCITIDSLMGFQHFKAKRPDLVIGDEVHSYGTKNRMDTLNERLDDVKYVLGLSATPERYYDPEGTQRTFNYFGPVIFEYGIKEAQKDGALSNYNYYLFIAKLTEEEEERVRDLTKKIGKGIAINFENEISEKDNILSPSVKTLMNQRAKVIKKARNKLSVLRRILEENKNKLKQCIVYCEDSEQLDAVQRVFEELKIDSYIKYHSGVLKRDEALNLFKRSNCRFILSMHCLDQGVNIPSCESLILLSSSRNPREYIQRRGRVLRNPTNRIKPTVKIYDILAFPQQLEEMYRGIIMAQLLRAWEFIRCSQSPEEKMKLEEILDKYNISEGDLDKMVEGW